MSKAKYYQINGIQVVEVPVEAFAIKMVDKKKKSCGENIINAGYFGNYKEKGDLFTLPAGHLVCDYEAESPHTLFYCEQRGKFNDNKFSFDNSKWSSADNLSGKTLSTLIVRDGNASIEDVKELPECAYAISGVPVLRHGEDCKWGAYVTKQGWSESTVRATWHSFVGVKSDSNIIYVMGMKTKTSNMVKSSEAFNAFKKLGLSDVIKLDGGGSFYFNADGTTKSTLENRRINSIITFGAGVDVEMTETELRKSIVAIMKSWLGYNETNGKHKKIIDLYNSHKPLARGYKVKYTDEWCATTVSAAFIKANLTDIAPTECSCSKMIELYKAIGGWQEKDNYVPNIGDIIMYDWEDDGKGDNTGAPNHVGIVTSVSGNKIEVIEGNKGQAVAYRNMAVDGKYIRGYCLPNYASKATKPKDVNTVEITLPVLEKGSKNESVRVLQILLNTFGFSCGTVDGSFGSKTLAAVKNFQSKNKLTVDGSVGKKTWDALLK